MEAYKVVIRERKGRVLTPAQFGCLEGIPAINITNGCLFRCTYCYARGYSQTPKKREVQLYGNLPNLLKEEIPKKRALPSWVILNTSSDCFQPHPEILNVAYQTMQILLTHGIGISFLTKGLIPPPFFDLFSRFPGKILPQIGLVSLSQDYWKRYEPGAPQPEERLGNIERFKKIGIDPEVRVDPIIPFVTDREEEVVRLFEKLRGVGIQRVTLSYLHLRPFIQKQFIEELPVFYQKLMEACFRLQEWKQVGSSTKTKLLSRSIREKGYERIKGIAERFGIKASICQCKNPDLQGDLCGSSRVRFLSKRRMMIQMPLFRCG